MLSSKNILCALIVVIVTLIQPVTTEYQPDDSNSTSIMDSKNDTDMIDEKLFNLAHSDAIELSANYSGWLYFYMQDGSLALKVYTYTNWTPDVPFFQHDSISSLTVILLVGVILLEFGLVVLTVWCCWTMRSNNKKKHSIIPEVSPSHLIVPDKTLNV